MSLCYSGGGPRIQVFRPTMEEMKDFSKYISYMESQGANKAGIAKIIPPKEFRPRKNGYDDIGDVKIPAPIEQIVNGTGGLYQTYNIQQKPMTVREYKKLAESPRYKTPSHFDYADLIRKFWSNITFNPAIYGADISGSLYDPGVEEFNINHLGTILDLINEGYGVKIEGVNTAYLYFGMWKTTFAWHTEDMDLYSINYLHHGAPKTWYGIPPEHGRRLERLAAGFFHDIAKECPAFLRHKMSLISPKILQKFSIPFDSITQEEGEFMITFPFGYHAGFNHGFNCAESTNFALPRWVEYGKRASVCTCNQDNVKISMDIFVKTLQPDRYPLWLEGKDYGPHPEDPSRIYAAPPPLASPKLKKLGMSSPNSSLVSKRHPIFKKSLSSSEDDFAESTSKPKRKKKSKPPPPSHLPIIVINTKLQTSHVKKRNKKALQDKTVMVDGNPANKTLSINLSPIKLEKDIDAVFISPPLSPGPDNSPAETTAPVVDPDHFKDDIKLTEAELDSTRHSSSPKKEANKPLLTTSAPDEGQMDKDNQSLDLQDFASQWPPSLLSLWQHREPNLAAEQRFNMHLSAIYPHCAVCCITSNSFQLRKFPLPHRKVPPSSPVRMPSHYFDPTLPPHVLSPEKVSPLLVCEDCNVTVHAACYGVLNPPTGSWQCSRCARHDDYAVCSLCRLRGGALKPCTDSRWAHIHCTLFFSEVFFEDSLLKEPINITFMMVRKKMGCCYCQNVVKRGPKYRGGCVKCTDCDRTYHVSCGLAAGASFVLQSWPLPHCSTCTFSHHQIPEATQAQDESSSPHSNNKELTSTTIPEINSSLSSSCTADQEDILVIDMSTSLVKAELLSSSNSTSPSVMEDELLAPCREVAQEVELVCTSQSPEKCPSPSSPSSSSPSSFQLLGS